MLFSIAAPAEHARGPQYLAPALLAVHQTFRGRIPLELWIARHKTQVGLFYRAVPSLAPIVSGQLLAAYPDLRIQRVDDADFELSGEAVWFQTRLQLMPCVAALLAAEDFLDREQHRLADPLAAMLSAIASERGKGVRPAVVIVVRPVGRWRQWQLRRGSPRKRREERNIKWDGRLWAADIRVAVQVSSRRKHVALAKLHELAGVFAQYLPAGDTHWKLSRVHTGPLRKRLPPWGRSYFTSRELALLWHPPTASVRTPQMRINEFRELEPPPRTILPTPACDSELAVLGRTTFRDRHETFGLLPEDRFRHAYIVGQTGVGKTTLLTNLIAGDIAAGRSTVVLDPHGDMIDHLLDTVPKHRTNDVILFDPGDLQHAVTYNPLAYRGHSQRSLIASAVITSFKRLFGDSWGPRLEHILRNCVLTLLENPGATLVSLHRLLTDDSFRKQMIGNVRDEMVRAFWHGEWEKWPPQFRAEATSPVLNKVGALVGNPILRNVLGDPLAKLDLRNVLDSGKILLCNLSKGKLGDDASSLLGSLLVAGVQLAAMSRADQPEAQRVPAFLYVDELQNFVASETFPTLLSEMRKFKIALHAANQYFDQLDEATLAAVWGNVGTIVAFRLGQDAEIMAEQLGGGLLPEDLRNLPKHHAYVRLLIDGLPSRPFTMKTLPPGVPDRPRGEIVRRVSRERFGKIPQKLGIYR